MSALKRRSTSSSSAATSSTQISIAGPGFELGDLESSGATVGRLFNRDFD